ncbi:MAG: hypothetical protein RLZZ216_1539 [Cyanobacteriota bacterium]|jgi:hypothetical protein
MKTIRRHSLSLEEWPIFLVALIPVVIFVLGHLLYDVIGISYYSTALRDLQSIKTLPDRQQAISAGILWAALAHFYLVASLCILLFLFFWLRDRVRAPASLPFYALAGFLSVLGVGYLLTMDHENRPIKAIFVVTFYSLSKISTLLDMGSRLWAVNGILSLINLFSVVVPACICSFLPVVLLRPVDGWTEEALLERVADLRQIGTLASVFMVAGVLHMYGWLSWAPDLMGKSAMETMVSSISLYWGCVFAAMIASIYIPIIILLQRCAAPVMQEEQIPIKDQMGWLIDRGLSFKFLTQVSQLLAVLAPLVAAPAAKMIGALPDLLLK